MEKKESTNKRSIYGLLVLIAILIMAFIVMFRSDFIVGFLGITVPTMRMNLGLVIDIVLCVIGGIVGSLIISALVLFVYKKLPLKELLVSKHTVIQKKKFLPRYRVTTIVKIKGLPRKTIRNIQFENEKDEKAYPVSWDIISSISQSCKEINYWITNYNNRIQVLFSVSSWSWFSKDRAINRTKQGVLSLEASFSNRYPSIMFEKAGEKDANTLTKVLEKCKFGLELKGIPALKATHTQIDRLINTYNSLNEDSFFVLSMKGVKRGKERNNRYKIGNNISEKKEYVEDFKEAKKTGQSSIGIYSFTESENGMHAVLAALLSIWSGTHSFKVRKLGDCSTKTVHRKIVKMNPLRKNRLSNRALSCIFHMPEKPFFTEDTGQPIFEIPHPRESKKSKDIIIGNIVQNEKILDTFSIDLNNFHYNVEIVGMIGRGKTYLVATILEQLLKLEIGCLIFDLKGEYSQLFLNNPNVIVYTIGDPAPLGINLFLMEDDEDVQSVLALISEMLIIAGAPFSPTMLNIFEAALHQIMQSKEQNLEEFMYCLRQSAENYRKDMQTSYSRDSVDAILNRLNFIFGGVNYEVFSAINNTIDFEDLDKGKKIILDFSEVLRRGANTASLFLICNLVLHLLSKYASKKGITNKLRYLVVLEEAMYLIPKRFNLESAASIGYSEQNFIMGRSLGIGTISVYQLWDSVSPVVHANSLTKILFRGEDIEKIRKAINLSDDHLDYLPHLPDRYFIIKSKSLSGPALLKTRPFRKKPVTNKQYKTLARQKYLENGNNLSRINKSLMEIRKLAFSANKRTKIKSWIENPNISVFTENKNSAENSRKFIDKKVIEKSSFHGGVWENCFDTCIARISFQEKHSSWIQENICKKIRSIASRIVDELLAKNDLVPIIKITKKNPLHLTKRILLKTKKMGINEPEILCFCILNLILEYIRKEEHLSFNWKNKSLAKIRNYLIKQEMPNQQY